MGKVMVTGALGNVGGYVAKYLIENSQDVYRFKTFLTALQDVDRVFIVQPPHLGKPEDLKPFVETLKSKGGIKLVSFLSLIGVENNPVPPHHKIEKYIERAGLPYCHIIPVFSCRI